jgi:membrane protease YdiL (CAAX protease family)
MNVAVTPVGVRVRTGAVAWAQAALIAVGLGAAVAARLAATRAGLDPILVGAGFGIALLGLVLASGERLRLGVGGWAHALAGAGLGLVLVAVVIVGATLSGNDLISGLARPASPFAPWALVTIVVAVAEEAVLRGLLFARIDRAAGTLTALLVTTVAFALMHVPLYGWHVVPLDLGVGLALGGLRIATRGLAAPAMAHAVADLATWWL